MCIVRIAAVAGFAVVALRHPDGFCHPSDDGPVAGDPGFYGPGMAIPAPALDQVAFCSIYGLEDLDDLWLANHPAFGGEPLTQWFG